MIPVSKLLRAIPVAREPWLIAMVEMMPKFSIIGLKREAAFLGQMRHECNDFTRFVESLNYTDPERVARIFRKAFDLDSDKIVDPEEIEFAKNFVRNPLALANRAYANRNGNGNEASGDGWRYRGRCPIQLTFKDNYRLANQWAASELNGVDLIKTPDELLVPRVGCAVACGFWKANGCNELADVDAHRAITGKINPGMAGLDERIKLVSSTLAALERP